VVSDQERKTLEESRAKETKPRAEDAKDAEGIAATQAQKISRKDAKVKTHANVPQSNEHRQGR
jgi:hypothetical protein